MKPEWLVKINVSKFQENFPKYEFSALLFMFVHGHLITLVGKENNFIT